MHIFRFLFVFCASFQVLTTALNYYYNAIPSDHEIVNCFDPIVTSDVGTS